MSYYDYHAVNKQRIRNGELVGYYFTGKYKNIGEALVLLFDSAPFKRPIRPYRWVEYLGTLIEWGKQNGKDISDLQSAGSVRAG